MASTPGTASEAATEEPYDVITMGRIGVDIYPLQTGVPLPQVETFGKFLGGSATNVAVAAARLGRGSAVVSRTGNDPFGEYCHQALRGFGVDDRWVTPVDRYPTPVTFCEIFPPDDFPLYFYREPKAPDLELGPDDLDLDAIGAARIFWVTGTGLCAEPSRTTTLAALESRAGRRTGDTGGRTGHPGGADGAGPQTATVFDMDWRPMFWGKEGSAAGPAGAGETSDAGDLTADEVMAEARPYYRQALANATVAVGNLDECEVATGTREPQACADALLEAGVELAVVKQGPKGVLAAHRDGTRTEVPPHPVEVVNGLGAGDSFGGSLCHGLLAGWDVEYVMRYANAAGALVASRLACSAAMPTADEVEQLMRG
ncbi:5-dehydro-2-deoxygluconokinase [Streptomyces sp. HNM0575]|uniref:5-dehydro-2-deoxygluconokinase n=1 Tax=Streptomyces sp. HNM0575 TaxID=2716338 RepID=UPI00145D0469|nr:5-dehydro-2-deoxygluconokinase [Streptomyces sp. HNM0575]NLU71314.1 5-dehydro-2-deoxygluconokinase [Streptomyces sp. HNM0575]